VEAMDLECKILKFFKLEIAISVNYFLFVKIHGHEVFVETPFCSRQYFAKVFMEGTKYFDEETLIPTIGCYILNVGINVWICTI
jgi:hypothetical protein